MIKKISIIFIFFISIGYICASPIIPKEKSIIYWDAKDHASSFNEPPLSDLSDSYNIIVVKSASMESGAIDIREAYKLECFDDIKKEIGDIRTRNRIVLLSIEEGNPESFDQLNLQDSKEVTSFIKTLNRILDFYKFSGISFEVKNDPSLTKNKISNIEEVAKKLKSDNRNLIIVVTLILNAKAFTDEGVSNTLDTLTQDNNIDWIQVQTESSHHIYVYDKQSTESISAFEKRFLPLSSAVQPTEL